ARCEGDKSYDPEAEPHAIAGHQPRTETRELHRGIAPGTFSSREGERAPAWQREPQKSGPEGSAHQRRGRPSRRCGQGSTHQVAPSGVIPWSASVRSFKKLNLALVFLSGLPRAKRPQVSALAGLGVRLAGIQTVVPTFEFANHKLKRSKSWATNRLPAG